LSSRSSAGTTTSAAESNVANLELKQLQLLEAARMHEEWRVNSLPPEGLTAQREYQNWLYAMAQLAGWEDLEVGLVGQNNRYDGFTTVTTTLDGATTLDGINQFLSLMESTGLVHRISALHIESTDYEGNPEMNVSITLEGVAMKDAASRSRLFPTALLAEECSRQDDVVRVDSVDGFPEESPFRIRIGDELLDVVGVEDNEWQVERGVANTFSRTHDADDIVELLPVRESVPDAAELALVVHRIFVLPPQVFAGRKQFSELPPAIRGREFSARLEVENWGPQDGTPRFELLSGAPEGLEFNPATGQLDWEPAEDAELATYDLKVAAYGADSDEPVLEDVLALEVRRPNRAPRLAQPGAIDVWLGRSVTFTPQVEDPDLPNDELTFSLSGDVPDDASFDRRTGEFRWTPSVTEDLEDLELELTVTDTGVPPESDQVRLVLALQDDSATYTKLVGTIVQGKDQVAWLYDRSTNERIRLTVGAEFEVADVTGTVEDIRLTAIDVRSEGALYELSVGDSLRDWRLIEPAATNETSSAAGALGAVDAR